eukprot:TRINITY_DN56_c0_g1_i1.p2 TRINITY_DN56_c0_g1~~TRINITY_DN56_c0_g1_i1.p2  ORF type:complete len:181 (+),score=66.89 TRINITY_DN56_c0_g1_i1:71-613(+)
MWTRAFVAALCLQQVVSINLGMSPMARLAASKNVTVDSDPCPFGSCGGGGGPISASTKAQVASILEGILGSLQRGSLLSSKSAVNARPAAALAKTPAPVKEALQSLLSTVSSTKSQRQEAKVALAKMLSREVPDIGDVGCTYFRACAEDSDSQERPIDSQTKAEVAQILEGIISNLSKHH